MPESLAFAAALPAFVFQNVAFDVSVKLVDENKTIVTSGTSKELAVTLRFHDSYDIVADQSDMIELQEPAAINAVTGLCQLQVVLKSLTASNEGRPFCLEVRSADGDAESVFSTPLTVVKEKLRITQQPPDVWFKDEGGREKCMTVTLVLEPAPGAVVEDRVIPLDIRLLYESGNPVVNQSILRLFPDMRPNMSRGRVTVSFRIDDVSKNHQGQSFILEIAPEKQESSLMFQEIAPARTSVIAIRSKRNKRKLTGAASAVTKASPRSVAGTPRANLMMIQPPMSVGPPQQRQHQQARRVMHTTPTNSQYAMIGGHHASSGRPGDMGMATWSSHVQQPQATTPMHHASSMNASTPMHHAQTPMSSPTAATTTAVEWRLAGFEINADGSQNVSCPIYRCPQCKRLNDVEMMSNGMAEHSPQCVFASMMYRSQMEGAAAHQQQQQLQQQIQQQMQLSHQHYLSANGTPRQYQLQHNPSLHASTAMTMSRPVPAAMSSSSMLSLDVGTDMNMQQPYEQDDDGSDNSPKTLAALMSSSQRPVLTISPYMNKVTGSDDGQGGNSNDSASDTSPSHQAGNLFASHAFRNQMEISEVASSHLNTTAKQQHQSTFLEEEKPEHDSTNDDDNSNQYHVSIEDNTATLSVGVGTALFNEMSSMGISLDSFDKSGGGVNGGFDANNPLADFTGAMGSSDEDQVFYILARMYTDVQSRKLGLPAFDQFQRMLGFYTESQNDAQTQVLFHALQDVRLPDKEVVDITNRFTQELQQNSDAVHSLPKYQHNVVMLREDALMYYWKALTLVISAAVVAHDVEAVYDDSAVEVGAAVETEAQRVDACRFAIKRLHLVAVLRVDVHIGDSLPLLRRRLLHVQLDVLTHEAALEHDGERRDVHDALVELQQHVLRTALRRVPARRGVGREHVLATVERAVAVEHGGDAARGARVRHERPELLVTSSHHSASSSIALVHWENSLKERNDNACGTFRVGQRLLWQLPRLYKDAWTLGFSSHAKELFHGVREQKGFGCCMQLDAPRARNSKKRGRSRGSALKMALAQLVQPGHFDPPHGALPTGQ
ncbi:hypothetical protein FI667_g7725, partial [Globisporangium splendens]